MHSCTADRKIRAEEELGRVLANLIRTLPEVSSDYMPETSFRVLLQVMIDGGSFVVDRHSDLTDQEKYEPIVASLHKCSNAQVMNGAEEIHSYRLMRWVGRNDRSEIPHASEAEVEGPLDSVEDCTHQEAGGHIGLAGNHIAYED